MKTFKGESERVDLNLENFHMRCSWESLLAANNNNNSNNSSGNSNNVNNNNNDAVAGANGSLKGSLK